MPKRRRSIPPDSIHHIVNRGNDRKVIFRESVDYGSFLALMREARERYAVELFAYCLMPNHFHLLLQCPLGSLSKYMQRIATQHSRRINVRVGGDGPMFPRATGPVVTGTCSSDATGISTSRVLAI